MNNLATSRTVLAPSVLRQLDSQFSAIDLLPESLLPTMITHPGGDLDSRCVTIAAFRNELLSGEQISSPCPWLPEPVQQRIVESVQKSGALPYCKQNEEITDALIQDLFSALESRHQQAMVKMAALLPELERQKLAKLESEKRSKRKNKRSRKDKVELSQQQKAELQSEAELLAWLQQLGVQDTNSLLPEVWQQRVLAWQELIEVFTDLGVISGLGFDLSKGFFQSHGWLNLVKLHKVIKKLPQLREVIQTLGRMKEAEGKTVVEEVVSRMMVSFKNEREVKTPWVPMETKGVTRSDSISRMLPQEAALLGHSTLKKLWHARRAEHGLLSYAVEGTEILIEESQEELETKQNKSGTQKNKVQGPMVVCLDTSGSMRGTPENIAKAIVLECLSVATKEKRRCFVYLFGSQNEVEARELTLSKDGLERMITFLSMSFGGGTDAEGPLNLALDKCKEDEWHNADILLVSDGEFGTTSGLTRKINQRKEQQALSVHGILIGSDSSAMRKACDPLHQFSEWAALIAEM